MYWTYYHEPEDNIEAGAFTAAQYRAAWQRISSLALRANNPRLHATLILMCYTLTPASGRSFADYYPGDAYIDVLAWDCYNQVWAKGQYIAPADPVRRCAERVGGHREAVRGDRVRQPGRGR